MEPWLAELNAGRPDVAWDSFVQRYRRLILATIRRLVHDGDDVMDVFSGVCAALHAHDLERLRQFLNRPTHNAKFSTWLVVVVRNLTIDWIRQRDGRRRPVVPADLTEIQREIYTAVFLDGRSHRETYEIIASRSAIDVEFSSFLREIRETYRRTRDRAPPTSRSVIETELPADDIPAESDDPIRDVERADAARHVAARLASLPPDIQLAIQMLIVERVSAANIARVLDWPNAKTVYNRVYRALEAVRKTLERSGIRREDL